MSEKIKESRIVFLFEAIRHGSVRAAAEALNVAPSAVSRQIALLEDELSIPLIERHTRGVKPTEAGQLLLSYFREQRSHQHDLLSRLQELRGLRGGKINIALGEGFLPELMEGVLARFGQDYPNISLSLSVGGTDEVVRWVVEDEADIGVAFNPPQDQKIVSLATCKHAVQAIVYPGFPLLEKPGPFRFADFMPWPLALNHPSFGMRQILMLVEQTEKIRMAPILTANSFFVLRQFVKLKLGITFLPTCAVTTELANGEVFAIPIKQSILENAEANLIKRAGRQLSFAAERMMQYMVAGMDSLR